MGAQVGPRTDAFCAGAKPPALLGALTDQDETMLCIHTAGSEPALASLEAREQASAGRSPAISTYPHLAPPGPPHGATKGG